MKIKILLKIQTRFEIQIEMTVTRVLKYDKLVYHPDYNCARVANFPKTAVNENVSIYAQVYCNFEMSSKTIAWMSAKFL